MINSMKNLPILHYENFCLDPKKILKEICFYLEIDYENNFENFSSVILSGDSGRSSNKLNQEKEDMFQKIFKRIKLFECLFGDLRTFKL